VAENPRGAVQQFEAPEGFIREWPIVTYSDAASPVSECFGASFVHVANDDVVIELAPFVADNSVGLHYKRQQSLKWCSSNIIPTRNEFIYRSMYR
jgi:hypothetical protein